MPELPKDIVAVLTNLEEAVKSLPQEEQDAYRRCQESVIEARRSAQENEGRIVICAGREVLSDGS